MDDTLRGGLTVVAGMAGVLLWVLSAEYLAATLAAPIADALGVESAAVLVTFYVAAFGVVLAAPFLYVLDWDVGETARSAGYLLGLVAWFVAADAAATPAAAATGLPYGGVVAAVFVVPFAIVTAYRLRGVRAARDPADSTGE